MAGRDGSGAVFSPGSRGRDRTVDDALKTLERLADWLDRAREENVWAWADPITIGMLHGMLVHVRAQIDGLLQQGGEEVEEIVQGLRTIASRRD
jgi:hypothetical protein